LNGTVCNGGSDNAPPTVTLTAPTSGQTFPSGTTSVTLSANASDPDGAVTRVEFRVDGTLVGTDTQAPYTFTATGLGPGSHTAQATAFDHGYPTLSASTPADSFTIAVDTPKKPPTITLTAPTSGQTFPNGTTSVTLSATASDPDGAVTRVEFRVDGNLVETDTQAPYSVTATGLSPGSHTAQATAFDDGNPSLSTSTP